MEFFLGIGPPFVNPGVCPTGQHLDSHYEGASSQLSASIPPGGAPPLSGSCPLGRRKALATVFGRLLCCVFRSMVLFYWILLDVLVAKGAHPMLP